MLPLGGDACATASSIGSPASATWLYLSFEFLVGLSISGFLLALNVLRLLLPRPPRDLSGDVVVVTGAASSALGGRLAEEFARAGCSVVCVDGDAPGAARLASRLNRGVSCGPADDAGRHRWSRCDPADRSQLRSLAEELGPRLGGVDVLVTCCCPAEAVAGAGDECSLERIGRELASHYWTVLAFLPSMLHRDKAHVIGITQAVSKQEACMGSKAAIAGLMESLDEELRGGKHKLTFMTVAPKAESRLRRRTDAEIAIEVVQAVQRDLPGLHSSWSSRKMYEFGCRLYGWITAITTWLDT